MRLKGIGLVVTSIVGVAIACGGSGDDSGGPSDGGDEAPSTDGGGTDTASNEASSPSDGGADGKSDGGLDASKPSPCVDASHWLCDDFDRDGASLAPWGAMVTLDGSVAFEAEPFASSRPNVLFTTGDPNGQAEAFRGGATTMPGLDCAFDMTVAQVGGVQTRFARLIIQGSDAQGDWGYYVSFHSSGTDLAVWENGNHGATLIPLSIKTISLPVGTTHVSTSLKVGPNPHLVVAVGGVAVVSTTANDLTGLTMPTQVQTFLGVLAQAGSGPEWKVGFDNVVCDLEP